MRSLALFAVAMVASACSRDGFALSPDVTCEPACGDLPAEGDGDLIDAGDHGADDVTDDGGDLTDLDDFPANAGAARASAGFGGAASDEGYDVAIDTQGNVVIVGETSSSIDFGGGVILTNRGLSDGFVLKLDADGTPLWVLGLGGPAADRAQAVALDAAGDIYVSGLFAGTATFAAKTSTAIGQWDAFVVAITSDGSSARWLHTVGTAGREFAYDVATGPSGEVAVGGYYEGSPDLGDGPLPGAASGGWDAFAALYDNAGTLQWAKTLNGVAGSDRVGAVAIDRGGGVYIGGETSDVTTLDGSTLASGAFLARLHPDGGRDWARGLGVGTLWAADVRGDHLVVAGYATGAMDLGAGSVSPINGWDAYVASYSLANVYSWGRVFGGTLSDLALGVAVDSTGRVYVVGMGGADIDFGDGALVTGHGDQDIFVVGFDAGGLPAWGELYGGSLQDRGYGLALAEDGRLIATGRFAETPTFVGQPASNAGGNDLFMLDLR